VVCSFLRGLSVRDVEAALEETFEEQIVSRAPCRGSVRTAASATGRGAGVGLVEHMGRPCVDDRVAFTAIVFVLLTGVPWPMVPTEIGCSGVTAWRRLRTGRAAGVWERLHRELLRRLNAAGLIDWTRAIVESSYISALQGL
jgi:transposase